MANNEADSAVGAPPDPVFQCMTCVRYDGFRRCRAYPGGIPDAVLFSEHDHRKPYNGDNGVLWSPRDGGIRREPVRP